MGSIMYSLQSLCNLSYPSEIVATIFVGPLSGSLKWAADHVPSTLLMLLVRRTATGTKPGLTSMWLLLKTMPQCVLQHNHDEGCECDCLLDTLVT